MAIISFSDRETERFFVTGKAVARVPWRPVADVAKRKLDMLHYARQLRDLRAPPGNRLEALHGHLKGRHSIRINERWRVVFRWTAAGAADVSITDCH